MQVIEGARPVEQFNHRTDYGTMWHLCEEELAESKDCSFDKLVAYCQQLSKKFPTLRDQIEHWYNVCLIQFPIYVKYWRDHPDVVTRTPLMQEQVFQVPYNLPSGRTVYLRGKFDSVDLIDKGVWLQENKTKGDIDVQLIQRALADPALFKIFTFHLLRGSAETALADKFAAVLTESMALKYFGDRDPVGRTLRVNGEFDVRVSAVIRDIPVQSSLRFDAVVPFVLQFANEPTHWGGNPFETWALLAPGAGLAAVAEKITAIAAPNFAGSSSRVGFRLHPLLKKRLYSPEGNSLIRLIALFCGTALFVLAWTGRGGRPEENT